MSPILFFIFVFTCIGVGKIFLQINSAAVAFIDILIAAWEGLITVYSSQGYMSLILTFLFKCEVFCEMSTFMVTTEKEKCAMIKYFQSPYIQYTLKRETVY